jgi:acetyl-CoA carboxylase biotin carboxylase subunit
MTEAALAISKRIGYESVGTVEFLVDLDTQNFYFLEMNTRIQVEHPVTEAVTGVDLVQEQIRVADGQPLRISQGDIRPSGHAIECRINAESPLSGFQPCPGRIDQWEVPEGEGIRIDTHCYPGYIVSPYYDSLLCKVISWGKDRGQAIERMSSALGCFRISGLTTTLHFHKTILESDDFIQQNINTRWVETVVIPQMGGAGWVR